MRRDDAIRMAREAGYYLYGLTETHGIKTVETDEADEWTQLERFAAMVATTEREACAQVCDTVYYKNLGPINGEVRHGIAQCASAIRARGTSDGLTT